jgi:hypothetical protein
MCQISEICDQPKSLHNVKSLAMSRSGQTLRDYKTGEERVKRDLKRFHEMEGRLMIYTKGDLLRAADQACEAQGIRKPDRLCRRYRNLLICFIRDNFPGFPEGFPPIPLLRRAIPKACDFGQHVRREDSETQHRATTNQHPADEVRPSMDSDEWNLDLGTNWPDF